MVFLNLCYQIVILYIILECSFSYNVNMDDNVKVETLSCRIVFFPPYICFMSVVLYDVCQCTRQFDISDTGYSTYVILWPHRSNGLLLHFLITLWLFMCWRNHIYFFHLGKSGHCFHETPKMHNLYLSKAYTD
jgi:hypothetical protein